jgi:hypothetical protein
MADKKISALPAATTPLAGTEVLPIVQGGTTDQVSVADLTAGRAVNALSITIPNTEGATSFTGSGATIGRGTAFLAGQAELYTAGTRPLGIGTTGAGNLNLYTGSTRAFYVDTNQNFVVATAGKGIDFSATAHTGGMTSELLNDYEEGTWTPSSSFVTLTINDTARYIKIGTFVYLSFDVTFPSTANGNAAEIRGLPFASGPGASKSGTITWSDYGSQLYIRNDFDVVAQIYNSSGATIGNNFLGNKRVAGVFTYNTYPL